MLTARVAIPLLLLSFAVGALAADPIDAQAVARKLLATTVTVRISSPKPPAQAAAAGNAAKSNVAANNSAPSNTAKNSIAANNYGSIGRNLANANSDDTILLASGVSLGGGLIVTFGNSPTDARYRATLPDGQQAEADLRVADDYTGLRLIEIDNMELAGLTLSDEATPIGMTILTAAAAGIERPVVSLGILGAVDRPVAGVDLPPLLLCDVRSTDTSTGAAIVDGQARLIGIVAAVSNPGDRAGWAYAVPVRHVARLVSAQRGEQLVVLRRQRPSVGLTLGSGPREGSVQVERVEPGGPAQRAGVQAGDLLLEAEGRKVRSAYQAVDLILKKQPGEKVELVVEHSGQSRPLSVTLGGAAPAAEGFGAQQQDVQVGPQLGVRAVVPGQIEVRRGGNAVENFSVNPNSPALGLGGGVGGSRLARDEVSLLKAQLSAFESAIAKLQEEVRQREESQAKTQHTIQQLTAEVERLRKQLDAKGK